MGYQQEEYLGYLQEPLTAFTKEQKLHNTEFATQEGLRQRCIMSLTLFIVLMDNISEVVNTLPQEITSMMNKVANSTDDVLITRGKKEDLQNNLQILNVSLIMYSVKINSQEHVMVIAKELHTANIQVN